MTLREVTSRHTGLPAAAEPQQASVFVLENKEGALQVCADYRVLYKPMRKDAAAR